MPAATCATPGDTAWMMVSTVLVLGMVPGLAFFEAGLLRKSNVISLLTHVLAGFAVSSLLWFLLGFTLVYGDSHGGIIGSPSSYPMLFNIADPTTCIDTAPSIPGLAFALFEMMFAAITPLLITGAYAERLRLREFLIVNTLWEVLVYYPVAHWLWGTQGGGGWLFRRGALDFAGGIVIHATAGVSALVFAVVLGKRAWADARRMHNVPLAMVGGALLWMGWFGFNAGSALGASPVAAAAVANTQVAAVAGAAVWLGLHWRHGVPSVVELVNGGIVGLAAITPASGYVCVQVACLVGLLAGLASHCFAWLVRDKLQIDDALDVSAVHGMAGVVGSLVIGAAASTTINPAIPYAGFAAGGSGKLMGLQVLALVVAIAWAGGVSLGLALLARRLQRGSHGAGLDHIEHHAVVAAGLGGGEAEPLMHAVNSAESKGGEGGAPAGGGLGDM